MHLRPVHSANSSAAHHVWLLAVPALEAPLQQRALQTALVTELQHHPRLLIVSSLIITAIAAVAAAAGVDLVCRRGARSGEVCRAAGGVAAAGCALLEPCGCQRVAARNSHGRDVVRLDLQGVTEQNERRRTGR